MIEIRIWQDRDGNWCGTGTFTDPDQEFVQYQPTKQITVEVKAYRRSEYDGNTMTAPLLAASVVQRCYSNGYKSQ